MGPAGDDDARANFEDHEIWHGAGARVAVMDESMQKRGPIIAVTGSKWPDVRGASRFRIRSWGIPIDTDSGGTANDFKGLVKTLQNGVKRCACLQGEVRAAEDEKCPNGIPRVQPCNARSAELAWPWTNEAINKFQILARKVQRRTFQYPMREGRDSEAIPNQIGK